MNSKVLAATIFAGAVLIGGVCAIVCMNKKESAARRIETAAEAKRDAAQSAEREAASLATAENAKARAAKDAAVAAEENRKAKEAERETAKLAAAKAETDKAAAVANREAKKAEAEAASANRAAESARLETARVENDKAKKLLEIESANAAAAEAAKERERLAGERVIAEAKVLELRAANLAELEQELLAYKRDLDEREAALRPDKTIADLVWVSEGDTVIGEDGLAVKKEKVPYLAENDPNLAKSDRTLAKSRRELSERQAARDDEIKSNVVSRLETLYRSAVADERFTDARFYEKNLKALYPDWKYTPPDKSKKEEDKK